MTLLQVPADPKAALYIRPTLIGCCCYNKNFFPFRPIPMQCLQPPLKYLPIKLYQTKHCCVTINPNFEGTEACFGVRPSSSALFFILLSPVCYSSFIFNISIIIIFIIIRLIIVILTGGGLLGNRPHSLAL